MAQFTAEEADLWRADLHGLDQAALFEAIRQVKRTRDSIYPQLAWVHEAYREMRAKARAARPPVAGPPAFAGDRLTIDPVRERQLRRELEHAIETAGDGELDAVVDRITREIDNLEARSTITLMGRVRERRDGGREAAPAVVRTVREFVEERTPAESAAEIEARRQTALRVFGANA
jgi:hypothetical protein